MRNPASPSDRPSRPRARGLVAALPLQASFVALLALAVVVATAPAASAQRNAQKPGQSGGARPGQTGGARSGQAAGQNAVQRAAPVRVRGRGFAIPRKMGTVPGKATIWVQPGTTRAEVDAMCAAAGCAVQRPLGPRDQYLVSVKPTNGAALASADDVARSVAALKQTGRMKWAAPDRVRYPMDVPNDPMYPQQWYMNTVNMPVAWSLEKGAANVVIMDIDSGCDTAHPDLAGRIVGAKNFVDGTSDVTDNLPHGTNTAGIMAAATNNGAGIAGVAWQNVGLYIAKVGDEGFDDAAIVSAINYAQTTLATGGTQVIINMSFGGPVDSDTPDLGDLVNAAVKSAADAGLIVVCAAGNLGDVNSGNPPISPANCASLSPNILCVTACGPQLEQAFYSEARPYTTVAAPGGNDQTVSDPTKLILSTEPTALGSYGYEQGTSMSAAVASGVVSLLLSASVPAAQVKPLLETTANPVNQTVPNNAYGYGVIDAGAALSSAVAGVVLVSPLPGSYVYGQVPIQLRVINAAKFQSASVTINNDPTVIGTTSTAPYTITWNSQATDANGNPKYADGPITINVKVNSTGGPVTISVPVILDNPVAAITSPAPNAYVSKSVNVVGTANAVTTPTYTLEYSRPSAPTTWTAIASNKTGPVIAAALATWSLTGLADGPATLRLRVDNAESFEVATTETVTIDQTPPSVPQNLSGQPANQSAILTWTASTDNFVVAGYNIYRSDAATGTFTKVNAALAPTAAYTDTGLVNKHTYYYKVSAVDGAGNESAPGNVAPVTPNTNGTTAGQVSDVSGNLISGATITVQQNGAAVANGVTQTNTSGQYSYPSPPGFPTGTYDVRADDAGYIPQLIAGVQLALGSDATGENFVLVPQPNFPAGWSMFTLPYDYRGAALPSVLTTSNLLYYNPASGAYVGPGQAGFPTPAPGIGYWVDNTGSSPTVTGAGVAAPQSASFAIPIHKGWNLLGNPFEQPIHWQLGNIIVARSDNGQQASLSASVSLGWTLDFAWGGVDAKSLVYDPSVIPGINNTIPVLGAFWFNSSVDGTLTIPPPSAISRAAKVTGTGWALQLKATAAGQSAAAYVGVGATSRTFPVAPAMGSGVTMALGTSTESELGLDLRTAGPTQTWNLNLRATADNTPVTLTWPSAAATLPRGWKLILTDVGSNQSMNLATSSGYTVAASRAPRTLKVQLVRDSGIRVLITDLAVTSGTGRAASPIIRFSMSNDSQAAVSIIRENGQTVRTLTSRSIPAGPVSMVWDLRDNAGNAVPSGVYLVQVRATGASGDSARAVMPFVVIR